MKVLCNMFLLLGADLVPSGETVGDNRTGDGPRATPKEQSPQSHSRPNARATCRGINTHQTSGSTNDSLQTHFTDSLR